MAGTADFRGCHRVGHCFRHQHGPSATPRLEHGPLCRATFSAAEASAPDLRLGRYSPG
eukprot:CAMPEP_0179219544 /NCGR_PEP_ID=MMETSP0797-20121207/5094_1 /TAXON_ID=47934 /ORGANISM="Dinophysis acuminata, Strain DAEP01" /LENGTH=57 /DNA_ID=CAMNT_0020926027 /DNA_START=149 /DNA_END=319 /DNA_ORIENTATION=-